MISTTCPSNVNFSKENSLKPHYKVTWYVNNEKTWEIYNVSAIQAYNEAVPLEALQPYEGNRWHVMTRGHAVSLMNSLEPSYSLKLCYQDDHPNADVEKIIVTRID